MAHRSFGTVRLGSEFEPITLDFGLYGEERLTVRSSPSLADVFELYDAPEPTATNELELARILANFIRRMLVPEDVPRFNAVLARLPSDQAHVIVEAAAWLAEQVAGFLSPPATTSSGGRRPNGTPSKRKPGSARRSGR